ncbi:MAG: aminotransferase class V-fold PLP-dependent enzyme [Chloroflexota bacterium]
MAHPWEETGTPEVYRNLGVKPVINAQSWVTVLGGSLMAPEVLEAMQDAARAFVRMEDLHRAAGRELAEAFGTEAGLVTGGAAAGCLLMSAACMVGADPELIQQLPDTTGLDKTRIAIFRGHRNGYDGAFELSGARLLEWGEREEPDPEKLAKDLEEALTDDVFAVAHVFAPFMPQTLPLPRVAEIAHARGLPVIVDASAELPPAANLTRFTREGADMVTFSGGKGLGGPQGSGVLVGRADLIEAAFQHTQNQGRRNGVGRPAKVSKEDIVGLVTAVRMFTDRDHDAVWGTWRKRASHIVERLQGIPGTGASLEDGDPNRQGPQAVIYFHDEWSGPSIPEIRSMLQEGDPPIYVGGNESRREINVVLTNVQPGEEEVIADRLEEILRDGRE